MEELTINFFSDFKGCPARINIVDREISFNLSALMVMAMEEDMTFNETFAMCMSHELIHSILFDFVSANAYNLFDNICHKKYKNMKRWIGGVGGK